MRRGAHALVYVALFAFAACGKTVDDPTFNDSGQSPGGGTAPGTAGSSSSSGAAADDSANDQGQDGTTSNGNADATTMAPGDSTGATTAQTSDGVADDGPMDAGGGCGDAMVSPGEQCDGADLQGFDCNSLGLSGGTLACDSVTCTFDTSMCMAGGTGG